MLTADVAARFAAEWVAAWNARDLDRILAHYADDFTMSSPRIAEIAGEPSGVLRGKAAIGAYWRTALDRAPALRFELLTTLVGADSVTLYYRSHRGGGTSVLAAEVFFFDATGTVVRAAAHYAA